METLVQPDKKTSPAAQRRHRFCTACFPTGQEVTKALCGKESKPATGRIREVARVGCDGCDFVNLTGEYACGHWKPGCNPWTGK